jgi:hypothetical protein
VANPEKLSELLGRLETQASEGLARQTFRGHAIGKTDSLDLAVPSGLVAISFSEIESITRIFGRGPDWISVVVRDGKSDLQSPGAAATRVKSAIRNGFAAGRKSQRLNYSLQSLVLSIQRALLWSTFRHWERGWNERRRRRGAVPASRLERCLVHRTRTVPVGAIVGRQGVAALSVRASHDTFRLPTIPTCPSATQLRTRSKPSCADAIPALDPRSLLMISTCFQAE